jgi:hypothetical protein
MACMNDATCKATVVCQYTCYADTTKTAAQQQTCANACANQTKTLFKAYQTCNETTTCMNQCACP